VRVLGERVGAPAAEPLRGIVRSQHGRPRREALEALELMGQARDEDRLALATAELSDKAAPCPAILNAVRVLVVAGTERAQALLTRTAAEKRRCGSREATDALRRLERAKAQAATASTSAATATSTSASTPTSSLSLVPVSASTHPAAKPASTTASSPASTASSTLGPTPARKSTRLTAKRRRKAKAKKASEAATAVKAAKTAAAAAEARPPPAALR
jgi:hypothetical protein